MRYLKVISPPIKEFEVCSNSGSPMQVIRPFVPTDASRRSGAVMVTSALEVELTRTDITSTADLARQDHDALARNIHLKIFHIERCADDRPVGKPAPGLRKVDRLSERGIRPRNTDLLQVVVINRHLGFGTFAGADALGDHEHLILVHLRREAAVVNAFGVENDLGSLIHRHPLEPVPRRSHR